jgi:hypothetical protein
MSISFEAFEAFKEEREATTSKHKVRKYVVKRQRDDVFKYPLDVDVMKEIFITFIDEMIAAYQTTQTDEDPDFEHILETLSAPRMFGRGPWFFLNNITHTDARTGEVSDHPIMLIPSTRYRLILEKDQYEREIFPSVPTFMRIDADNRDKTFEDDHNRVYIPIDGVKLREIIPPAKGVELFWAYRPHFKNFGARIRNRKKRKEFVSGIEKELDRENMEYAFLENAQLVEGETPIKLSGASGIYYFKIVKALKSQGTQFKENNPMYLLGLKKVARPKFYSKYYDGVDI